MVARVSLQLEKNENFTIDKMKLVFFKDVFIFVLYANFQVHVSYGAFLAVTFRFFLVFGGFRLDLLLFLPLHCAVY